MTNKQIFNNFIERKSITDLHFIFKVSEPTIKKWKSLDGTVPDYVIEIISLLKQRKELSNLLNEKQSELENIKFDIQSYFSFQKKLKKY